jgi:hypothetical protein
MRQLVFLSVAVMLLARIIDAFGFKACYRRGARRAVSYGTRGIQTLWMASDGDDDMEDMPGLDLEALMNSNPNIPKPPQSPEEIETDSFEGFLKEEYFKILEDNELLDFTNFYVWRYKMGIIYSEDEIADLFTSVIEEAGASGLDLMNFIKINRIIDESNAAIEDNW